MCIRDRRRAEALLRSERAAGSARHRALDTQLLKMETRLGQLQEWADAKVDFMEREHYDATRTLRRRLAEAEVREAELSRLAGQRIAMCAAEVARRRSFRN